jgi:cytochrome P450
VGVTLTPCIYGVHHRDDLYPDPEEFRPERFLEGDPPSKNWIPFGGGERYCIGRTFATSEIKVVLRTLALRTRLEPAKDEPEGIVRQATTIAPDRGATAVLKERVPAKAAEAA